VPQKRPRTPSAQRELRQQKSQAQQRKIQRQKAALIIGAVVAVIALMVVGDLAGNAGKIHHGVALYGVKLGGKTRAQAESYLTSELNRAQGNALTVTYENQSWKIKPADLGIRYDVKTMAADAYAIGREKNILTATKQRFASYFSARQIMLLASLPDAKAASGYGALIKAIDKAPVSASVSLKDGAFVVTEGSDGQALQRQTLTGLIAGASITGQKRVKAPVKAAAREISPQEARAAADVAQSATKTTITAKYEDKTWPLESDTLRKLIVFKASNDLANNDARLKLPVQSAKQADKLSLVPIVASDAVAQDIWPLLGATVGYAPVDASFSASNGAVTIIPAKNGQGADPVKLAKELAVQMQSGAPDKAVTVVTHEVEPALTTQKAEALGITERISTFTTNFSSGNAPRLNNIKLLAKALDGALVMPGETFSLNGTVGEANAAKGYQEAGAIVDGQLVGQIGGGICQVNTTLFNAALYAGVNITARSNHSLYISSYPLGRDAAVSWPGPDFKFVNTLDHAILIATSSTNSSVTVSFYGVNPHYDVQLTQGVWLSQTPAPEQRVDDPTLPVGTEVIKQQGRGGGKVSFTQTVTKAGALVFTKTYVSNYKTEPTIISVGTMPAGAQPASAAAQ